MASDRPRPTQYTARTIAEAIEVLREYIDAGEEVPFEVGEPLLNRFGADLLAEWRKLQRSK